MIITNIESGKPYQLNLDTALSVERTNPFFNEYGEQTLPVALPDSPYNRSILNQPGRVERKDKVQMVNASIQDGEYFSVCRQAILSVAINDIIETSFYMNDGSFYSKLEDTYITDIFGDEIVSGVTNVDQAIEWLRGLYMTEGDDKFACFEIVSEDEDGHKIRINQWERHGQSYGSTFYHAVDRVVVYDKQEPERSGGRVEEPKGKHVYISKGFYLSPFLKANYVLKRLFQYFGYTLQDNFFTREEQFSRMVFINNVADAIVTGKVKISQLIPKVTCKKILDLFRKKFCCEFITDEVNKTATIVLMNELIDSVDKTDLSPYLVGNLKVSFPEKYKQLVLRSADVVDSGNESSLDSLALIHSQFPTAQFVPETGYFIREGFHFGGFPENITEIVAETSQIYNEGGDRLESFEIEIPECIPASAKGGALYVGKCQFLNSSLQLGKKGESQVIDEEEKKKGSDDSMNLMLAFVCRIGGFTGGTVTNYASNGNYFSYPSKETFKKIGNYALVYNGHDGIFERFYRKYDLLLRNSLHQVEASFLLSQHQKQSLSAIGKVCVNGSDFLINSLKFDLGKEGPAESSLFTIKLYQPISRAKPLEEIVPPLSPTGYKWEVHSSGEQITKEQYDESPYKEVESADIFPNQPTVEDLGKQLFLRKFAKYIEAAHAPRPIHGDSWWLYTYWLEAVKV